MASHYQHTTYSSAAPYSSIPGPTAMSFLLANFPGGKFFRMDLREVLRQLRLQYGDLAKLPGLFGKPEILMSYDPDHFQTIFRTEGVWPGRVALDSMTYYRTKVRQDIYGKYQGLLNSQDKEWGEFRTTVNPVLIQPKTTKRYIPIIDEVADEFLERIRRIRNPKTNQLPEYFEDELNKWTLESICVIAMDTRLGLMSDKYDARASKFIESVKAFFALTFELEFKPSIWRIVATPKFKKLMEVLDTMTNLSIQYIDEAKAKLDQKVPLPGEEHEQSVLEKLLKIDPVIAIVMATDMIFAGVDTTSSFFTGVLYMLANNPDKQELLRKEILTILPEKNSSLTIEKMNRLPYLRACIKEAQRLLPTTNGNARCTGQDIVLSGYQVPKGTLVVMGSPVLQKEDKYYPDALKYVPERWLRTEEAKANCPASAKDTHPFVYMPFGFGPRMCIGRRMAEMEVEILTSKIIRNFYVSWEHPELKFKWSTLNTPDGKLMFTLADVPK